MLGYATMDKVRRAHREPLTSFATDIVQFEGSRSELYRRASSPETRRTLIVLTQYLFGTFSNTQFQTPAIRFLRKYNKILNLFACGQNQRTKVTRKRTLRTCSLFIISLIHVRETLELKKETRFIHQ